MYTDHFDLTAEPFNLTPDPAFLYLSPEHREALAAVQYGLVGGRGFITLIGEVGTGKTTLLYRMLGQRSPEIEAAYVSYTAQGFRDLLAAVLKDLKVEVAGTSKRELLDALNAHLLRRSDEGRSTALVIDEAQNLTDEAFEELRLLSNFETYSRKLVQIVLVGQPELQDRLRQPQLRQLRERVAVRAYINPLSRREMARCIAHRLAQAGGSAEALFEPRALRLIVRRAAGIPRRANILCHNAFLFAYGRNLRRVTAAVAREAIAEMDERRPGLLRRPAMRRVRRLGGIRPWAAMGAAAACAAVLAARFWPLAPPPPSVAAALPAEVAVPPAALVVPVPPLPPPVEPIAVVPNGHPAPPAPAAVAEEARPVPAAAPAAAADAPAAAPAPAAPAPPPLERKPLATAPAEAEGPTFSVVVPPGAALWRLARDLYGERIRENGGWERLLDRVLALNPQLKDANLILAGDSLRLPHLAAAGAPERSAP
jgi:general secretion pathway protein A